MGQSPTQGTALPAGLLGTHDEPARASSGHWQCYLLLGGPKDVLIQTVAQF